MYRFIGLLPFATCLGAVLLVSTASGQDAHVPIGVAVLKIDDCTQTSTAAPVVQAYDFAAYAEFVAPLGTVPTITLTGPAGRTLTLVDQKDGSFEGLQTFNSRDDLEAAFPDGSYTLTVGTTNTTFQLTTSGPTAPSQITNFAALQAWPNPNPPIQWQPINGAVSTDLLTLTIDEAATGVTRYVAPGDLAATATLVTAQSLPLNTPLVGDLTYLRQTTTDNGSTQFVVGRGFHVAFPLTCVVAPPVITKDPVSQNAPPDAPPVTLSVAATGTALTYQWNRDNSSIPDATDSTYTVSPYAFSSSGGVGLYTVTVRNLAGSVTSRPAIIARVLDPSPAVSRTGFGFNLNVTPTNSYIPYQYQWKHDGVAIAGASEAQYSHSDTVAADAGNYTVDLTAGSTTFTAGPVHVAVSPGASTFVLASKPGAALSVDSTGNVYFGDGTVLRKMTPSGSITVLAGGQSGYADGTGANAQFRTIGATAIDANGNIFVADTWNSVIRKVTPDGTVTTVAGRADPQTGSADGVGIDAVFSRPGGLAIDRAGNVFVADTFAHAIRKISPDGTVTTVAGALNQPGSVDGTGAAARFYYPNGIAVDADGNLIVADGQNNAIRKVTPAGVVTTIAGTVGTYWADNTLTDGVGANAIVGSPGTVAVDATGNIYFADKFGLRRITPQGVVQTLVHREMALGVVTIAPDGSIYVGGINSIEKVTLLPGGADPGVTITTDPRSWTIAPGTSTVLTASASGPGVTYQWARNGVLIPGATGTTYLVRHPQPGDVAAYTVVAGNAAGAVTSRPATLSFASTNDIGRIQNLSVRAQAGSGDQTLIVGTSLAGGSGPGKTLVIRGIGPTLAGFGVSGALSAVSLQLVRDGRALGTNSKWGGGAALSEAFDAVGAFPLPAGSSDAALMPTLTAGTYSVQVTGTTGGTGIALAELYDSTPGQYDPNTPRLLNVSARCQVGTGDNVLIAGFVIGGSTPKTVLIRGIGPGLTAYGVSGVLYDPVLEVRTSSGVVVATNDNWGGARVLVDTFNAVGAFPLNEFSPDAALVVTLDPGAYSAVVKGFAATSGQSGVALVEVYEVP